MRRASSLIVGGFLLLGFALYEIIESGQSPGQKWALPFSKTVKAERQPASVSSTKITRKEKSALNEDEDKAAPTIFFYCSSSEAANLGIDEIEVALTKGSLAWLQFRFSDFSEESIKEPFKIEGERYSTPLELSENLKLDSVLWNSETSELILLTHQSHEQWLSTTTNCSKN